MNPIFYLCAAAVVAAPLAATAGNPNTKNAQQDIVDTAVAAGSFKTLVAAVQAAGLETGLVDTKVCAVDETWSGLCFMRRRADPRHSTRDADER